MFKVKTVSLNKNSNLKGEKYYDKITDYRKFGA